MLEKTAKLLFEANFLKKIQRTGYPYLGDGKESVGAHSFGVVFVAFVLCKLAEQKGEKVNEEKVLKMALIHDLPETRTGDFNAVNKKYDQADEKKALEDAVKGTPVEKEVFELWKEYRDGKTFEARLTHDADVIDLILQLKEIHDLGNPYAIKWISFAKRKLQTPIGKEIVQKILETEWCSWWFDEFKPLIKD